MNIWMNSQVHSDQMLEIHVNCVCNISPLRIKLACMNLYCIQHTLFDCQQRQKTFLSPMSSTSKLVTTLSSSILIFLLIRGLFCSLLNIPKEQEKDKSVKHQNFHPLLKLEPITECIYSYQQRDFSIANYVHGYNYHEIILTLIFSMTLLTTFSFSYSMSSFLTFQLAIRFLVLVN